MRLYLNYTVMPQTLNKVITMDSITLKLNTNMDSSDLVLLDWDESDWDIDNARCKGISYSTIVDGNWVDNGYLTEEKLEFIINHIEEVHEINITNDDIDRDFWVTINTMEFTDGDNSIVKLITKLVAIRTYPQSLLAIPYNTFTVNDTTLSSGVKYPCGVILGYNGERIGYNVVVSDESGNHEFGFSSLDFYDKFALKPAIV